MGYAVDCHRFIDKWPNLEGEINRKIKTKKQKNFRGGLIINQDE
jgi:hypothetical protein